MAVSNSSLKAAANGSIKANGNGRMNGKPPTRKTQTKQRKGFVAWVISTFARLTTWAAILTILFRCPPSLDACDESSPFICKYYFQTKNVLIPHVQPYYEQYGAPYVDVARPYYNALETNVITPTRSYAVQYGAPWAEKAQDYAVTQWRKNGQPQVAQLQSLARTQYDEVIYPHVSKIGDAMGPYYEIAQTNSLQLYYEYLLPGFNFIQPYAIQGYDAASDFTTGTALPTAYWAWDKTYVFLDTNVWPQVRGLYLENVEPQLVRIGERLGRYKTKTKTGTILDNLSDRHAKTDTKDAHVETGAASDTGSEGAQSSFSKPPPQHGTVVSPAAEPTQESSQSGAPEEADDYWNPVEAPPAGVAESEKRTKAREMVAQDLKMWQNKFASQADEGAADMEDRVDEIAREMMKEEAGINGKGLVKGLEDAVKSELDALKSKLSAIVQDVDHTSSSADEQILGAVRAAGVAIKSKAQAIRDWRETYDKELQAKVVSAADVHFQILDETRGLALQQIGMKWAWADGVTYKDWAKYHELKSTLNQWTEQLKQLIVSHPALVEAQEASSLIEDDGMEAASAAAKELARLKEVAHWKFVAQDATDNFESEAMRLAAEAVEEARRLEHEASAAAEDVTAAVSETVAEASSAVSETVEDAASTASGSIQNAASAVSEEAADFKSFVVVHLKEASDVAEDQSTAASQSASSMLSEGDEATNEAVEAISETVREAASAATAVVETEDVLDELFGAAAEMSSSISLSASSVLKEASGAAFGATSAGDVDQDAEETAATVAFASEATGAIVGDTEAVVGNTTEAQPEHEETPSTDEETVSMDEDEDENDLPVEVQEDPMTEREDTPPVETPSVKPVFLGAAAQEVPVQKPILDDYVDSDVIASATDAAAAAYTNAVSKASEHYSSAVSVVSAQIYGTPKPVHEQLLGRVSSAYDNAVAAASVKFDDAVSAASNVYGTPTATAKPTMVDWQKVESIAAQRLNEGRLWAELQYESAVIALGLATPTPTSNTEKAEQYYEQAKRNYYAGLGIAQERYSSFLAAASSAMSSMTATPTPTDWLGTASSIASVYSASASSVAHAAEEAAESAYSVATDNVASAASAVDDSIAGMMETAEEQAYLAGAAIAETWDIAIAEISGRVYGEQASIGWYDGLFKEASAYASSATEAVADGAASATDAAGDSAVTASAEAARQYDAVSELVSELLSGKEPPFTESVLSRLSAAYATASSNVGSYASEASAAAHSVGDKVGSAASQATEAIRETVEHMRDEL